jgi:hypothetical protein
MKTTRIAVRAVIVLIIALIILSLATYAALACNGWTRNTLSSHSSCSVWNPCGGECIITTYSSSCTRCWTDSATEYDDCTEGEEYYVNCTISTGGICNNDEFPYDCKCLGATPGEPFPVCCASTSTANGCY